ncbi:MAG: transglutaminase domain-containing protein [Muribaculaceae bacterium]|nr:transglutaminase domain-containing protein [Muribaculaceae bacterium]
MNDAWGWYYGEEPTPVPDDNPIPPKPYEKEKEEQLVVITPQPVPAPQPKPQPKPVVPIYEKPTEDENVLAFDFYGMPVKVRFPIGLKLKLNNVKPQSIANGWEILCIDETNNTIRDCLEARIRYNLSDWAYLLFLDQVGKAFSNNTNEATLLTAFLYCQSGYQMRLAIDNDTRLKLLYGSEHHIYNQPYFKSDGVMFYPFGKISNQISICNAEFENETPLSLIIDSEQTVGNQLSDLRHIHSDKYPLLGIDSKVPIELVKFFDSYPTSQIGNNPLTRWAMYANVPLAERSKELIYPQFKELLTSNSELEAANKLLDWVQTGFIYEYDDKVWGHDRAFFAEETLFYPYADCEDRSILFSRLIRDLLGLDVALVYYPGHLATAVAFNEDVYGDAMMINGRKFTVCDPTYIGAPVGAQMPGLDYSQTEAIVLKR